ncbi:hypothetical protein [Cryobacterium sp. MDB2-33-2]|uniref:hypothetical protein n=1 Tax=Cryobacterium sp. MDB2-33-2 TaxID=1259179 RepID=UPI00106DABE4|nr:hypothetical protein [Cryobacterium sp. MDB2-33-2]TFC11093.1 hypothetical protein E3O59_02165 [Cryobacterium sp. MDB2-33-2]
MTMSAEFAPTPFVDSNPVVLAERPIRREIDPSSLSRFHDRRWDLTPGIFEDHSTKIGLTFDGIPEVWRAPVKEYFWLLINKASPLLLAAAPAEQSRPSLRTITFIKKPLTSFLLWAETQGLEQLSELDAAKLDRFLSHLGGQDASYGAKSSQISEVRRLWTFRTLVQRPIQMPESQPWLGQRSSDLLGRGPSRGENSTPRISDETLVPLMSWAFRFVERLGDDIVTSFREYSDFLKLEPRHRQGGPGPVRSDDPRQRIEWALDRLKMHGFGLPGRTLADGKREIRWNHLCRLAESSGISDKTALGAIFLEAGLPIDDDTYLFTSPTATIDDSVWQTRIRYDDAPRYAQILMTACFIVIAYLSGMRPGEVLSLRRNCLRFDETTGLWLLTGTRWKGVVDGDGNKDVRGQERTNPWVIHPVAARAIQTLHELHSDDLLFPLKLRPRPLRGIKPANNLRPGSARTTSQVGTDISNFTMWVNEYCVEQNRLDVIPDDPCGRVSPNRFRRTLAWHIVRRPRGLIAAAIQYGHLATWITQGYAGDYSSGFLDDLALERWLERIENVEEMERYLDSGGHVSGPAATEFAMRTRLASAKFVGRIIPTKRQSAKLIEDPSVQVFQGNGMHCVFNSAAARCVGDSELSPTLDACQGSCSNIARTDADVAILIEERHQLIEDSLAPAIRYHRVNQIRTQLNSIIDHHEGTRHGSD